MNKTGLNNVIQSKRQRSTIYLQLLSSECTVKLQAFETQVLFRNNWHQNHFSGFNYVHLRYCLTTFWGWRMDSNHSWSEDKRALICWVQFLALQYKGQKRPIWKVTWVWSDLTADPSSYEHSMICLFLLLSTCISSTFGFYRKLIYHNYIGGKKKPWL